MTVMSRNTKLIALLIALPFLMTQTTITEIFKYVMGFCVMRIGNAINSAISLVYISIFNTEDFRGISEQMKFMYIIRSFIRYFCPRIHPSNIYTFTSLKVSIKQQQLAAAALFVHAVLWTDIKIHTLTYLICFTQRRRQRAVTHYF